MLLSKSKKLLSPVHYYPFKLAENNFYLSLTTLLASTQRASRYELNYYKIEKILYSITTNCSPFALFNEILSHAVLEKRRDKNTKFLDMSRTRVGRQSLANRLNKISPRMTFEWLGVKMSKETLRTHLKRSFFAYLTI